MDLKKTFANPWVLGGGAALALVLILTNKGGGGSDNGAAVSAVIGAQMAQNQAGMNFAANSAAIAAGVTKDRISAGSQESIAFLSVLQNMFDVQTVNDTQRKAIDSSVMSSIVSENANLTRELGAQWERLASTWVSADVAKTGIMANKDVAKYGMMTTLQATAIQEAGATSRQLGEANIKAGSDALGNVLRFATGMWGK